MRSIGTIANVRLPLTDEETRHLELCRQAGFEAVRRFATPPRTFREAERRIDVWWRVKQLAPSYRADAEAVIEGRPVHRQRLYCGRIYLGAAYLESEREGLG